MPEQIRYGRQGEHTYDADDHEFDQGPPDDNFGYDPTFGDLSRYEKLRRWHEFLCRTMENMSAVEIAAAQQAAGGVPISSNYVQFKEVRCLDGGRSVLKSVTRDVFDRGPADSSGNFDPHFHNLTEPQKENAWEVMNAHEIPGPTDAQIAESNARAFAHYRLPNPDRFTVMSPADTKWSTKKAVAVGATVGSIVTAVLATITSVLCFEFIPPLAGPAATAPDQPANPIATASLSNVTVSWGKPTGDAVDSYTVTLVNQTTQKVERTVVGLTMRIVTFQSVPAGTYAAQVVAVNAIGQSSPAQTASVSTPATESIDWNIEVDQATIAAAMQAFGDATDMAHDLFWKAVLPAVDPTGPKGQITYEDQLQFALYLALCLLDPDPPISSRADQYAAEIANAASPPFPTTPRAPGDAYINPVPLWTAASELKNTIGTTNLPVRTQLFGLVRCLEIYLDVDSEF